MHTINWEAAEMEVQEGRPVIAVDTLGYHTAVTTPDELSRLQRAYTTHFYAPDTLWYRVSFDISIPRENLPVALDEVRQHATTIGIQFLRGE